MFTPFLSRAARARLMFEQANRDARRLPTKAGQGTVEYLRKLLTGYREAAAFYAAHPPVEFPGRPSIADLEAATRREWLHQYRVQIMTEVRRLKLYRDAEAPAYGLGSQVWFPGAMGYSVVVFGDYRDGEGWSYVYSHPFENGGVFTRNPAEVA